MTVNMPSITVYSVKIAAEPHSTPETAGCVCDGCAALSCISQPSRRHPWRYWCDARHRRIEDLAAVECAGPEAFGRVPKTPFPEWLRAKLAAKGMTQDELARKVNANGGGHVTHQAMSKYATGQNMPYARTRARIYAALGCRWPGETQSAWGTIGKGGR